MPKPKKGSPIPGGHAPARFASFLSKGGHVEKVRSEDGTTVTGVIFHLAGRKSKVVPLPEGDTDYGGERHAALIPDEFV